MALRAVLFDMEGLLVRTEETWLAVEYEVMAALGGCWGPEHQRALLGSSLGTAAGYLRELAGGEVAPEQVAEMLLASMERRLRAGPVAWMPGAQELLQELRAAGVPCGLVSASFRRLVDAVLAAVGGWHFAVTVAGDEVERTKPHPDPYLRAAALLGVPPSACVVLEDSPTGVAAAMAAGCPTVAVPSLVPVESRAGLRVVRSLREDDLAGMRAHADAAIVAESRP